MLQSRIFEPETEETEQPQTNPDQILVAGAPHLDRAEAAARGFRSRQHAFRKFNFRRRGHESIGDHTDLIGVDREFAAEAHGAHAFALGFEAGRIVNRQIRHIQHAQARCRRAAHHMRAMREHRLPVGRAAQIGR